MTTPIEDPTPRKAQRSARATTAEHDATLLTEADLGHVTGAGSKPGVSPGIGIGKPGTMG